MLCLVGYIRHRKADAMWNIKNKMNEQMKQRYTHGYREHFNDCQLGEGLRGVGDEGEEIKRCKLVVAG